MCNLPGLPLHAQFLAELQMPDNVSTAEQSGTLSVAIYQHLIDIMLCN
jgi:hypothetical protein